MLLNGIDDAEERCGLLTIFGHGYRDLCGNHRANIIECGLAQCENHLNTNRWAYINTIYILFYIDMCKHRLHSQIQWPCGWNYGTKSNLVYNWYAQMDTILCVGVTTVKEKKTLMVIIIFNT